MLSLYLICSSPSKGTQANSIVALLKLLIIIATNSFHEITVHHSHHLGARKEIPRYSKICLQYVKTI